MMYFYSIVLCNIIGITRLYCGDTVSASVLFVGSCLIWCALDIRDTIRENKESK
jgi:hypothetical protein